MKTYVNRWADLFLLNFKCSSNAIRCLEYIYIKSSILEASLLFISFIDRSCEVNYRRAQSTPTSAYTTSNYLSTDSSKPSIKSS